MFFENLPKTISSEIPVRALRAAVAHLPGNHHFYEHFFHCPTNGVPKTAQMRPLRPHYAANKYFARPTNKCLPKKN